MLFAAFLTVFNFQSQLLLYCVLLAHLCSSICLQMLRTPAPQGCQLPQEEVWSQQPGEFILHSIVLKLHAPYRLEAKMSKRKSF
jgi:hypothetical protein